MIETPDPRAADVGRIPADWANRRIVLLTGVSLAVALGFASFYPRPLVLPVFSGIVQLGGLATALAAALLQQRPFARHFNLWDKAVFLTFTGLAAGAFIDSDAVRAFIDGHPSIEAAMQAAVPVPGGN